MAAAVAAPAPAAASASATATAAPETLPDIAIPGQYLAPASRYAPGPGTHIHNAGIYASVLGPVSTSKSGKLATVSVGGARGPSSSSSSSNKPAATTTATPTATGTAVLPEVDAVVLARVTRLAERQATVEISVVGDRVCREGGFQGIVRKEDVRGTEKDKVKVGECFRVGDVIRGVVISLGDQTSYYISTASNEYGVVMAVSEAGNVMYPINWKEFRDPKTGRIESRKVAKPF